MPQQNDLATWTGRAPGSIGDDYRHLFNHVGVAHTDLTGQITLVNQRFCELVGYSADELLGKRFQDLTHPDDLPDNLRLIERLIHEGEPFVVEKRYLRKDGSVVWVSNSVGPGEIENGKPATIVAVSINITKRKLAEEALRESEERLRMVTDAAPALIAFVDNEMRYRFNNRGYEEWFGHPRDEMQGKHMREVLGDAAFESLRPSVEAALAGRAAVFEAKVPYRDGGERYIHANYVPHIRPDGEVAGFFVLVHDISESKRAESELRNRSLQFETLINRAPLGVFLVDASLQITQVNPVAQQAFENVPDGALGRNLETVLGELKLGAAATEMADIVRHTLATGQSHHAPETVLKRVDERVHGHIDWRVDRIRLPDGDFGVVCYFRDISEQVRAREAIAESEKRYRILFESIDEAFCVIEVIFDDAERPVDFRYVEVNPAFEKHTGLRNMLGRRATEMIDHEPHWFEIYGKIATTGEPMRFQNRASALNRWFDVYAFRVGDPSERKVAVIFSDITERKRTEDALRESDRRKDEFIATLAHELRNPLAAIRMATSVLGHGASQPQDIAGMTAIIERQTSQLVRLIDDLLDVNRINRGKFELRKEPAELFSIIEHSLQGVRQTCADKDVCLEVELEQPSPKVHADPFRLAQVISNLVNNACKFTEAKGQIEVRARREGMHAVVSIRDTGVGIAADDLDRIFEMFAQADNPAAHAGGGLGIGLALAKLIVEMHGGTIEARSAGRGQGSEFVVCIPILEAASDECVAGSPATTPAATQPSEGLRVLAVDDNVDALQTLAMMLQFMGHEVVTAANGREAIERAREIHPNLVLLDIGMPDIDGYEVARRIRQQPWGQDMFLVALSGWGQEKDKQAALDAGFSAHVTKPVDLSALEQLLSNRQLASPPISS